MRLFCLVRLLTLAALSLGACATKPPGPPSRIDPDIVSLGDLGKRDLVSAPSAVVEEIARERAAGEVVFVADDGRPVSIQGCTARGRYRWQPDTETRTIGFRGRTDSERHPLASDNVFADELLTRHVLRVTVVTSGRWVLDGEIAVPEACGHVRYAAEIAVGAYVVAWLADTVPMPEAEPGSSTATEERALPDLARGQIDRCASRLEGPPDGCAVPTEILAPRAEGTIHQRSSDTPAMAAAPACARGVALSGDLEKDVAALGHACGALEGFAPVTTAFERRLSEADGWQAQYEIALEAGRCYRVVVVGGRGIGTLGASVKDAHGAALASDGDYGSFAIVGGRAPFCATKSETSTAFVRVVKGGGDYAVWLWRK